MSHDELDAASVPRSEAKTRPQTSVLSRRRRAAITRRAAYDRLPDVALGLIVAYAVFGPVSLLRAGLWPGGFLTAYTAAALIVTLLIRIAVLRRRLSHHAAHAVLGLTLAVVVSRGLLGWAVFGDASQTGLLSVIVLAIGYACVSAAWTYALVGSVQVGWMIIARLLDREWPAEYLPLFVAAAPAAILIQRARVAVLLREHQRRAAEHRRQAELLAATARASENERRFRGIFERIQDVYLRIDVAGRIEMISPSVARFGYLPHELVGTPAAALFAPEDVARGRALAAAANGVADAEMRWRRRDGSEIIVSLSASVLRDGSGAVIGYEAMLRDISLRKQLEAERRQQEAELAHVLRLSSMGEMAAEMAHELTQPLSAMVNYASACTRYVRSGRDESAKLLQGLELIAAQGLRAGEIVRRIRSYVSKRPPQRELADVADLTGQAIRTVAAESQRAKMPIVLEAARGVWIASVDAIQIEQVLVNLLLNALEAVPAPAVGDRIVVRIDSDAGGQIEIAVSDPGCGLGSLAPRIFDPFFTTKPTGLGMGLAISRSIVESHGGLLWATPNAERGTTFHFTLPRAAVIASERDAAATVH